MLIIREGGIVTTFREDCTSPIASTRHSAASGATWDAAVQEMGGDLLQSWMWGEFKRLHGWNVERVQVDGPHGVSMAQILLRQRVGLCLGYLPRGPIIPAGDPGVDLLRAVDEVCSRERVVMLVVDPKHPLPAAWSTVEGGFVSGPTPFQAAQTVCVPLGSDDELLTQMRKDTRYNITSAQRNNVVVERAMADSASLDVFYRLLQDTSSRNGFRIHPRQYYADFLRIFDQRAELLFSRVDGVVTAGLISARDGREARSMYAGSATGSRVRGDTALLRFEAMRWAREHGCKTFDLGGIAAAVPNVADDEIEAGRELAGVRNFKVGFGGDVITFPATIERRYRPGIAWLIRNLHGRFRTPAPVRDTA